MEQWWNDTDRAKPKYSRGTFLSAALANTGLAWSVLG